MVRQPDKGDLRRRAIADSIKRLGDSFPQDATEAAKQAYWDRLCHSKVSAGAVDEACERITMARTLKSFPPYADISARLGDIAREERTYETVDLNLVKGPIDPAELAGIRDLRKQIWPQKDKGNADLGGSSSSNRVNIAHSTTPKKLPGLSKKDLDLAAQLNEEWRATHADS